MMKYLRARLGEKTTAWGSLLSLLAIVGSFFVPDEREDIEMVLQSIAVPIFVALFLWEEKP